jgi:hypothetical protein
VLPAVLGPELVLVATGLSLSLGRTFRVTGGEELLLFDAFMFTLALTL